MCELTTGSPNVQLALPPTIGTVQPNLQIQNTGKIEGNPNPLNLIFFHQATIQSRQQKNILLNTDNSASHPVQTQQFVPRYIKISLHSDTVIYKDIYICIYNKKKLKWYSFLT